MGSLVATRRSARASPTMQGNGSADFPFGLIDTPSTVMQGGQVIPGHGILMMDAWTQTPHPDGLVDEKEPVVNIEGDSEAPGSPPSVEPLMPPIQLQPTLVAPMTPVALYTAVPVPKRPPPKLIEQRPPPKPAPVEQPARSRSPKRATASGSMSSDGAGAGAAFVTDDGEEDGEDDGDNERRDFLRAATLTQQLHTGGLDLTESMLIAPEEGAYMRSVCDEYAEEPPQGDHMSSEDRGAHALRRCRLHARWCVCGCSEGAGYTPGGAGPGGA